MEAQVNKIKEVRKSLRLTQFDVAQAAGCTPGAIAHYENGRRTLNISMCRKLISVFNKFGANIGIDDLFPPENSAA